MTTQYLIYDNNIVDKQSEVFPVAPPLFWVASEDNTFTPYVDTYDGNNFVRYEAQNPTWSDIREMRDLYLSRTDWTQISDSPLDQSKIDEWAAYRYELRDIPQTYSNPQDVNWPTEPTT